MGKKLIDDLAAGNIPAVDCSAYLETKLALGDGFELRRCQSNKDDRAFSNDVSDRPFVSSRRQLASALGAAGVSELVGQSAQWANRRLP